MAEGTTARKQEVFGSEAGLAHFGGCSSPPKLSPSLPKKKKKMFISDKTKKHNGIKYIRLKYSILIKTQPEVGWGASTPKALSLDPPLVWLLFCNMMHFSVIFWDKCILVTLTCNLRAVIDRLTAFDLRPCGALQMMHSW